MMKSIHYTAIFSILILAFLFSGLMLFSQAEFEQHIITTDFLDGMEIIAVDLDQDGDPDLVAVGSNSQNQGTLSWFENDGNNNFNEIEIQSGWLGVRSVRAADINGDGFTDLVAAAWYSNDLAWFENDGNQNFTRHFIEMNFAGAHTVDIKDINEDGFPDVLCSGFDYFGHQGEIAWWENDGLIPTGWEKHLIYDEFQQSPFVYAEDLDGDDDIDIMACGELNDNILWWENESGNFDAMHVLDSNINGIHTVLARDIDMDGKMDVLAAACMGNKVARYRNEDDTSFAKTDMGWFAGALWLDAADLDLDGDCDLFGAGMSASSLAMWVNDGDQNFTKQDVGGSFTKAFCVVPVMMDDDDDIDLVAIGRTSNKISWFENLTQLVGADEIKQNNDPWISIFPNPFQHSVRIDYSVENSYSALQIFDSNGKLVLTKKLNPQENQNYTWIPDTECAAGTYTCILSSKTTRSSRKLIYIK